MSSNNILVLGAGLAGAGLARNCPGARIFEAAGEPGGYAQSHEFAGAWFDWGAHLCHSRDEQWLALVLNHAPLHEMPKSTVLNYKAGHWFAYPVQNHLADLPAADCRAALDGFLEAQEKYRGREPANYEEWCRFQYGDFLVENFYRLYTAKYWHTPMADLATDWLGGRLLPGQVENILAGARGTQEEKQAVFNRFRYPETGGFFALVRHLFDGLSIATNKRAVRVDSARRRVEFADGSMEDYDTLASTIPLPHLVQLLPDAPESVQDAAARLRTLRHACVNFVVKRADLSIANWFYVYDPDVPVSRVSFPYSLSGERNGKTAIQAETFFPEHATLSESGVLEKTIADMARLLNFRATEIEAAEICCKSVSYVVSTLERAAAVAHIREWLLERHIFTAGLFGDWAYIWSDRSYASGAALGKKLRDER